MTFIQLLLEFSSQTVGANANGPARSIKFLGTLFGDDQLSVLRDSGEFDARRSRWIIRAFDAAEQPLTDFYLARSAERSIKFLAGALYIPPNEYSEAEQPEITTYVWLPASAFDSVWNMVPILKVSQLQLTLSLTVPFIGSALNYSPGDPDGYEKTWIARDENPLLFESTEFHLAPIRRTN